MKHYKFNVRRSSCKTEVNKHHVLNMYGGVEVHAFVISAIDEVGLSASRLGCYISWETDPAYI